MEFVLRKPKIIILSGKAQCGKSVTANLMKEYYSSKNKRAVVIAFASYLKVYAKEVLDWDFSEESKPRDFLQQVGVELIKNQINPNMLINRIIEDIRVYSYFFDVIIVSDARFVDEILSIKNNFSDVCVINVLGSDNNLTLEQKNHSTETSLDNYNDYDYVIDNNSSREELRKKVFDLLTEV